MSPISESGISHRTMQESDACYQLAWDPGSSRLLSLCTETLSAARTDLAGDRFFNMTNGVMSSLKGYVFHRDGTLVISCCTTASTTGEVYEIRRNNVAINFGGSTDISTEVIYTMNIDFDAGDLLQIFWSGTSLTELPVWNGLVRWRE